MFSPADRERTRDFILDLAESDERVVAGAVVGSLAHSDGDRWSDLDLTFAVADHVPLAEVLEDWTRQVAGQLDAVHLFDLPSGPSIYRVFLLPGCLQFDLSFTPRAEFGARGPEFRLLFGEAVKRPQAEAPPAQQLFGYAVHHAVRARFCIERQRVWQAEYWISAARDYALSLACRSRGLPASYGRGFDRLPPEVHQLFTGAIPASLERAELLKALGCTIEGLLAEAHRAADVEVKVEAHLRELLGA